jgi:hypothetical protein
MLPRVIANAASANKKAKPRGAEAPKRRSANTTTGPSRSPALEAAATNAFSPAVPWNQRTKMRRRKIFCALSNTPIITARQRSSDRVRAVISGDGRFIRHEIGNHTSRPLSLRIVSHAVSLIHTAK